MNLIKSIAILVGGVVLGAVLMYCSMKPQLDGVRYEEDVVARTLAALSLERHGITPSKELINDVSKSWIDYEITARAIGSNGDQYNGQSKELFEKMQTALNATGK